MADGKLVTPALQKAIKAREKTITDLPLGPLKDYVSLCRAHLPFESMLDGVSGNRLSDVNTKNAITTHAPDLYVITTNEKQSGIELFKAGKQNQARCQSSKKDDNFRIRTVFPTKEAAKDVETACIYCTYSQVLFPQGNNGTNALAMTACINSLFKTRKMLPGNENAVRDTTKDLILKTAEVVDIFTPPPLEVLKTPNNQDADDTAGILDDDNVIETINAYTGENNEKEALEEELIKVKARVLEIEQRLTVLGNNKRAREEFGAGYDLPEHAFAEF